MPSAPPARDLTRPVETDDAREEGANLVTRVCGHVVRLSAAPGWS